MLGTDWGLQKKAHLLPLKKRSPSGGGDKPVHGCSQPNRVIALVGKVQKVLDQG